MKYTPSTRRSSMRLGCSTAWRLCDLKLGRDRVDRAFEPSATMAALSTARSGFWYYMTTCISDGEDAAAFTSSTPDGRRAPWSVWRLADAFTRVARVIAARQLSAFLNL